MERTLKSYWWILPAICFVGCQSTNPTQPDKMLELGVMNIHVQELQSQQGVALRGKWEFYWEQLLKPADFSLSDKPKPDLWIKTPQTWNQLSLNEKKLGGYGYATYRLIVKFDRAPKDSLALKIYNFSTCGKIFVNGSQVYEAGNVSSDPEEVKPAFAPRLVRVPSYTQKLDIIVQIANFHHFKGGFWKLIHLGTMKHLQRQWDQRLYFEVFFLSSIFIMGLYNLAIFWMRSREKSSLFFGLMCLFITLRITTTNILIILDFLPMDWFTLSRLEHLSFFFPALFFTWYLHSLFFQEFSNVILRVIEVFTIAYILLTTFFSTYMYTQLLFGYQIFTLLICIYFSYVIVMGFLRRIKGSVFFLAVWLLFFFTVVNDILYSLLLVNTGSLIEIGMFSFVLMQSVFLSIRFARVFIQSESLSLALQESIQNLEDKVTLRKSELGDTHQQLSKIGEELRWIERDMTDSILYARKIQASILPKIDTIKTYLPAMFIFYRPKDIVSGDFYWFGVEQGKIILAVADCTGHGVPGALMSMVGHDLLNRIIYHQHITSPDQILNELDIQFRATLKQSHLENKEGMDIALVVIDGDYTRLEFSGARSSLYYIQHQQLFQIEGDKHSIGAAFSGQRKPFSKRNFEIETLTTFYLFSDGYADQFGGEKGKKFLRKRFQKLLMDNSHLSLNKQETNLAKILDSWMNDFNDKSQTDKQEIEQTDDITIIGFKL